MRSVAKHTPGIPGHAGNLEWEGLPMPSATRFLTNLLRWLAVGIVSFTLLFSASPVALAQSPSIHLTPSSGPPTTSVGVKGSGFDPSEKVTITLDGTTVSTPKSNSSGSFSARFTVPSSTQPGNHTVQATDTSGLTASATFLVQTNWPMFGYIPEHTSFNPYENTLTTSNVSGLIVDWTFQTGNSHDFYTSPAVVNGVLYFSDASNSILYALNAATGTQLWTYNLNYFTQSSPAVVNGTLYICAGDSLYAINATTGKVRWKYTTGNYILYSSPEVVGSTVYFSSEDKNVYAVNAKTGAKLWSYTTGGPVDSSPAVDNGTVYIGSSDSNLYALNASNGTLVWSVPISGIDLVTAPLVNNGIVYMAAENQSVTNGILYALDAATGATLWSYQESSTIEGTEPAVANGVVYSYSTDGNLYALNATTGALLWNIDAGGPIGWCSAAVANGVLYYTGNNGFLAADATTGATLWNYGNGTVGQSYPIVANGILYENSGGVLYAFNMPGSTTRGRRPGK